VPVVGGRLAVHFQVRPVWQHGGQLCARHARLLLLWQVEFRPVPPLQVGRLRSQRRMRCSRWRSFSSTDPGAPGNSAQCACMACCSARRLHRSATRRCASAGWATGPARRGWHQARPAPRARVPHWKPTGWTPARLSFPAWRLLRPPATEMAATAGAARPEALSWCRGPQPALTGALPHASLPCHADWRAHGLAHRSTSHCPSPRWIQLLARLWAIPAHIAAGPGAALNGPCTDVNLRQPLQTNDGDVDVTSALPAQRCRLQAQCFCLPTSAALLLQDQRTSGWVNKFMRDWHTMEKDMCGCALPSLAACVPSRA